MNFIHIFVVCVFAIPFVSSFPKIKSGKASRIYGGEIADRNQYPFTAVIFVVSEEDDFLCGGALISNKFTLSTANCLYQSLFVRLSIGVYNYGDEADRTDISYTVAELQDMVKVHEDFDPKTLKNNIALLKIKESVEFSEKIQSIVLPPGIWDSAALVDWEITIIGWGVSTGNNVEISYPRHANVTILPRTICSHYYSSQDTSLGFCTNGDFNKGACTYDIGGAAVLSNEIGRYLVGLISNFGPFGCDSGWPTAYVSVARYVNWIREHAEMI